MESLKQFLQLWETYAESVTKVLIKLLIAVFVLINVCLVLFTSPEPQSEKAAGSSYQDCMHKKDGIKICDTIQR